MGWKSFHVGVVAVALTAAGLAALGLGAWFLYHENTSAGLAGLGSGLVLLFAATIDRFNSIKGLGMEAKTRKLDATIDKAEIALTQLRELTKISAASLVKLHCGVGRFDKAPGVIENEALANRARQMLDRSEATTDEVRDAMIPWLRVNALDVYFVVLQSIREALFPIVQTLNRDALNAAPAEKAALEKRMRDIGDFHRRPDQDVRGWTHERVLLEIENLMTEIHDLTDSEKAPIQREVDKAVRELRHLFAKLEFADRYYWENLPVLR